MGELFEDSALEKLFNSRSEELSHKVIKNSEEYKNLLKKTEEKLKGFLNNVPEKQNNEEEMNFIIDDFLFNNVLGLAEFWNSEYYKLGFADGLNLKKEVEETLKFNI